MGHKIDAEIGSLYVCECWAEILIVKGTFLGIFHGNPLYKECKLRNSKSYKTIRLSTKRFYFAPKKKATHFLRVSRNKMLQHELLL